VNSRAHGALRTIEIDEHTPSRPRHSGTPIALGSGGPIKNPSQPSPPKGCKKAFVVFVIRIDRDGKIAS